jgi:hypothetical protein
MELCNGEPSEPSGDSRTGANEPSPGVKQASSKKRAWSPDPREAETKRRQADSTRTARVPKSRTKQRPTHPPTTRKKNPNETSKRHYHSPEHEPDPDSTPENASSPTDDDHCHARKRHNIVEQKYRQRLNTQFEQLLDILPVSSDTDTRDIETDTVDKRRVSKGEVLDRARRYIRALEREHRRLVAERRELELLRVEQAYRG